jgi:hypothetical protein
MEAGGQPGLSAGDSSQYNSVFPDGIYLLLFAKTLTIIKIIPVGNFFGARRSRPRLATRTAVCMPYSTLPAIAKVSARPQFCNCWLARLQRFIMRPGNFRHS